MPLRQIAGGRGRRAARPPGAAPLRMPGCCHVAGSATTAELVPLHQVAGDRPRRGACMRQRGACRQQHVVRAKPCAGLHRSRQEAQIAAISAIFPEMCA